jgi:transposase
LAVINGSQGATALVDMADFVVGVQVLVEHEWWLYVETTADVTGCAGCGTRAVGHGRAPTKVRDLPVAGRPAVLVWHKRRWRCPDPDCDATTWSETCAEIAPRASLTGRARARLAEMVNVGGDSVAAAAAAFGVGWHTAHQAVIECTDPAVDDAARLDGVTAIGVDEKRFLNATAEHRTVFTTQIVDLDRHRLLDVIAGRSRDVLADWLDERGELWCDRIVLATLDPAAGYRRALLDHLDHATLVVDHFHAIKLANTAIDVQGLERPSREHPHARREDPPQRPRLHQPRQLSAPTTRPARRAMAWHTVPTQRIRGRKPRLIA